MADDRSESETPADDVAEPGPVDDIPVEGPSAASSATGSKAKAKDKDTAKEDAAAGDSGAPVVRKRVTSRRVTPKGAPQGAKAAGSKPVSKAHGHDDDEDFSYSKRYTPPKATYAAGPSPWWVPALMFGLLVIGALVIMGNYIGVFGDPKNLNLVIGLAFILGGIITATQYR